MRPPRHLAVPLALLSLLAAAALPAAASSTASSLASEGVSASLGSVSTSIQRSSDSSTGDRRAAAGDYRVAALSPAPGRAGHVQVALEPLDARASAPFVLVLPQQAADEGRLAAGERVSVVERGYGLEFAHEGSTFFLVLDDAWYRDLQTRLVTL